MRKFLLALTALLGSAPLVHAAEINLAEHLQEGGAAVFVTIGLSVLFVAVSIERLLHPRTRAIVPSGLATRARELWTSQDIVMLEAMTVAHAARDQRFSARFSFVPIHPRQRPLELGQADSLGLCVVR
jgi:biopolymer transport protein ExbB